MDREGPAYGQIAHAGFYFARTIANDMLRGRFKAEMLRDDVCLREVKNVYQVAFELPDGGPYVVAGIAYLVGQWDHRRRTG